MNKSPTFDVQQTAQKQLFNLFKKLRFKIFNVFSMNNPMHKLQEQSVSMMKLAQSVLSSNELIFFYLLTH